MDSAVKHKSFCSAGRAAPCEGYFPDDILPCVCGAEGNVVAALSELAPPAPVGGTPATSDLEPTTTDIRTSAAGAGSIDGRELPIQETRHDHSRPRSKRKLISWIYTSAEHLLE